MNLKVIASLILVLSSLLVFLQAETNTLPDKVIWRKLEYEKEKLQTKAEILYELFPGQVELLNSFINYLKAVNVIAKSPSVPFQFTFVVGNESCDLDSATGAVSYAYHLQFRQDRNANELYVPLLNISPDHRDLKTEVKYYFKDAGFMDILCISEVQETLLRKSKFILVDHHLPTHPNIPKENVTEIIDHHAVQDKTLLPKVDESQYINLPVASASTLVAQRIMAKSATASQWNESDKFALRLLFAPIILDSENLQAKITQKEDIDAATIIRTNLGITEKFQKDLFDTLRIVLLDLSGLSSLQILYRDLKYVTNVDKTRKVAVPYFPMTVREFMSKNDAENALKTFLIENVCDGIFLIGKKDDDKEFGIITKNDDYLNDKIVQVLRMKQTLKEIWHLKSDNYGGRFFQQLSFGTRKMIVPIIQEALKLAVVELAINDYLKEMQALTNPKVKLVFVMGNESCDLDSVASAISLAYFYTKLSSQELKKLLPTLNQSSNERHVFIPLLQISTAERPLKTDVIFSLQNNNIEYSLVPDLSEVDENILKDSKFILVGHQVSASPLIPTDNVIQIIDHHAKLSHIPYKESTNDTPGNTLINIVYGVRSCSLVIANIVSRSVDSQQFTQILRLLRGAIITSDENFASISLTQVLQTSTFKWLERTLQEHLFKQISSARNDISGLDSMNLLKKDSKFVTNKSSSIRVAIPFFPITVEEYMGMEDADSNLMEFGMQCNCSVILLLGMRTRADGSTIKTCAFIPANPEPSPGTNEFIKQLIQRVPADAIELPYVRQHKQNWKFFLQNKSTSRSDFVSIISNL